MTVRDALQLTAVALAMTVTASFRHYPFSAEPQLIAKRAFDIILAAQQLRGTRTRVNESNLPHDLP